MEDNKVPQRILDHIVISLYFTIAYAVLIIVYLGLPTGFAGDFLLKLFIACSLLFSIAIYFACKSYKKAKISSIILIIINALGLLIPLILLLMIFT